MFWKTSALLRCWLSGSAAALLAFYIGYISLHLSLEEHSHDSILTENSHHHEHDAEHEHERHSSADHSLDVFSKDKSASIVFDIVASEISAGLQIPISLPVCFLEPFNIPDESPPELFSPRGPPLT